jgi:SAM-dependent methyltransferase
VVDEERLRCPSEHHYPIVAGVPVMLLAEAEPTHGACHNSLVPSDSASADSAEIDSGQAVDPVVQQVVAATNGMLYVPLIGKLPRYPIPELRLPPGAGRTLLDVGCNWGRWSVSAARKGYQVVGIDPDLGAVLAATRVARQLGVPARYVVGDARHLPFATASFDRVFSYSVLQHFSREDTQRAIRDVARVLRPGGEALIQMANKYGLRSLYHQARRRFRPARAFEVRYWAPGELRSAFGTIGETRLSVDGFFGLGIQPNDLDLLPVRYKLVIRASESLRRLTNRLPWLLNLADSLYVRCHRTEAAPRSVEQTAHAAAPLLPPSKSTPRAHGLTGRSTVETNL